MNLVPNWPPRPPKAPSYFSAAVIGSALGVSKKTAHNRARRERWSKRRVGNRMDFRPPDDLQAKCLEAFNCSKKTGGLAGFAISKEQRAEVIRALNRFAALSALNAAIKRGRFEAALAHVEACFDVNRVSLRQWAVAWKKYGFAGLLENKRGRSGRRADREGKKVRIFIEPATTTRQ